MSGVDVRVAPVDAADASKRQDSIAAVRRLHLGSDPAGSIR